MTDDVTTVRNQEALEAAQRAFQFICDKLGEGERLYHSYRAGKRKEWPFADDYAAMIRAAGFDLPDARINLPYLWWSREDLGFFETVRLVTPPPPGQA